MATIHSPRRALADRDVNKPIITNTRTKEPKGLFSLGKGALSSPIEISSKSTCSTTDLSLASPQKLSTFDSRTKLSPTRSSLSRKRSASALDYGDCEKIHSKDFLGNNEPRSSVVTMSEMSGENLVKQGVAGGDFIEETSQIKESSEFASRSSFDTSKVSKSTAVTQPEPLPAILPTPNTISQDARDSVNALRLRLRVAMYKVRTNQTDVPLSKLKIYQSSPENKAILCDPLSSPQSQNLANASHTSQLPNPASRPCSPPSPTLSSSHSSARKITTPMLRHIQADEDSVEVCDSVETCESSLQGDRSRDCNLETSAIEGRAADSLLSLKKMR